MTKKHLAIGLCFLSLVTGVFALTKSAQRNEQSPPTGQTSMNLKPEMNHTPKLVNESGVPVFSSQTFIQQQQSPQTGSQTSPAGSIPEHIVYEELFYNVNFLKKKAEEIDRQGKDSSGLRSTYKKEAKLNDRENDSLFEIASNCQRDVDEMDKRAKQVITAFRSAVASMEIKAGQTPPPPPEELKTMQQERDGTILRARDQLRMIFGQEGFQRFDDYVQHSIKPRIRTVPLKQLRKEQD